MNPILIADDESDIREALQFLLKCEGLRSEIVASIPAALKALEARDFSLMLMDLNYSWDTTSGREGLEALPKILAIDETLPVVAMTAWATVDLAVEAMKRGARDFFTKPWDNDRVICMIRTQLALGEALKRSKRLEHENRILRGETPGFIASCVAMRPVLDLISRVGPSDANVLVTGENGSGKGVVARALHDASRRASNPMISVNMGGFSDGLFESELFGHVKGAFTDAKTDRAGRFELANGGTLFLDEIANLPLNLQAKLLRVIETGEFERVGSSRTLKTNTRIVSATNANLHAEIAAGRFRQDLLFRLNTIEIRLPALRERPEDIPNLAAHFLDKHAKRYGKRISGFEEPAMNMLLAHHFPGNVRELDHILERAVLMSGGTRIQASDLGLHPTATAAANIDAMSLDDVEKLLIQKTLAKFPGNTRLAWEALGLSRSAFYRRLQKHGL
ncbi:MAG TPA: sigma-54 dependent transcriptional regulator [Chthoniobacterales bacterium]